MKKAVFQARCCGNPPHPQIPVSIRCRFRFVGLWLALHSLILFPGAAGAAELKGIAVVRVFPHDPGAFTQGLIFEDEFLYEGTGRNGESSLRKVDLKTGALLKKVELPREFFGEGITAMKGRIYQLTWKSGIGFIYDQKNLRKVGTFRYPGEGWGLTDDGSHLILSDGSSVIRFLEPSRFKEVRRIRVHDASGEVSNLNELEFVLGHIFANIWNTDHIVQIAPDSGKILARYDLSGLLHEDGPKDPQGVLNGIAFDEKNGRVFVTGKLWPKLFEVRFMPALK